MNWLAYQFHVFMPFAWRDTRLGWWLLPYAGNWEYRHTDMERSD